MIRMNRRAAALLLAYWRALRVKMGVFALALCVASASLHGLSWADSRLWLVAATCAWAPGAIVALNDWVDREHDRAKGRTLASDRPSAWIAWTLGLWLGYGALLIGVGVLAPQALGWLGAMAALGAVYSWLRAAPLVSGLTVSLSYALIVPAAASLGQGFEPRTWTMALTIALAVYGRETIADLEDLPVDRGYKATLPVLLGASRAALWMSVIFGLGAIMACLTSPWMALFVPLTLTLIGAAHEHPLRFKQLYQLVDAQTVAFVIVLCLKGG